MARIFITGSSDGLGSMAAKLLADLGHQVVLHARNDERAKLAMEKVPEAENVLIGDPFVQEKFLALCEDISGIGFPSE